MKKEKRDHPMKARLQERARERAQRLGGERPRGRADVPNPQHGQPMPKDIVLKPAHFAGGQVLTRKLLGKLFRADELMKIGEAYRWTRPPRVGEDQHRRAARVECDELAAGPRVITVSYFDGAALERREFDYRMLKPWSQS